MQFEKLKQRMSYLEELISNNATGTSMELARRLGISRRMVFRYINHLQETHSRQILYCKRARSYKYKE